MPLFEYVCQTCGRMVERLVNDSCVNTQRCVDDGSLMQRRPSTASFSVKGFNAKNGYASGGK